MRACEIDKSIHRPSSISSRITSPNFFYQESAKGSENNIWRVSILTRGFIHKMIIWHIFTLNEWSKISKIFVRIWFPLHKITVYMQSRTEVKIYSFTDSYDFVENLIIPKYFDNVDKFGMFYLSSQNAWLIFDIFTCGK